MKILLYQHEVHTCPMLRRSPALHVVPLSPCPLEPTEGVLIHPRGEYIDIIDAVGQRSSVPCGSIVRLDDITLLVSCIDYPFNPLISGEVDAVLVYTPVWSTRGEALREARRLTYRLMMLSFLTEAPVIYVNRWGMSGGRVYVGSTGVYDYRKTLPIAVGGYGDAVVEARLG